MIKQNIKSSQKNEKGIALIFSLIFLSLLLILALAFALDSMFDQKAAYNSANASSAGLLARAQLNQIMTLIEQNAANYDTNGKLYSHDLNGATDTDMLADRLRNDVDPTGTATWFTNIEWNYIRNGTGATDPIIGRTAFVVVPDDQLPLDSLISKAVDESGNATAGVFDEERIGKEVSEINVRYPMSTLTPAMADVLNWDMSVSGVTSARPAGKYKGIWSSYDEIFGTGALDLETAISNDSDRETFKETFMNTFKIDAQTEREAFWADISNYGVWDSDEYYARFNLARTDWDKSTWQEDLDFIKEEILMEPDATSGEPTAKMQQWLATDTNLTKISGLAWIACFGYNDDGSAIGSLSALGSFATIEAQRGQIAANLKDYCDDDEDSGGNHIIRPTSDVDPATWYNTANIPSFTGNEMTPYINKIGLQFKITRGVSSGTAPFDYWANIEVIPHVELINIFGTAFNSAFLQNLKIKVVGKFSALYTDVNKGDTRPQKNDIPFTTIGDVSTSWSGTGYLFSSVDSITSYNINLPTNDPSDLYFHHLTSDTQPVTVSIIKPIITKVVFYYDDGAGDVRGYDYVKTLGDGGNITNVFNGSTGTGYCWFGWAVHDPRQNLNQGDWIYTGEDKSDDATQVLSLTGASGGPYTSNHNANNPVGAVTDGPGPVYGDPEPVANVSGDPADLSTAYIRNAPMESPWELGFIHRGKKWQTLNLKAYRKEKAIKTFSLGTGANLRYYIPGGGDYTEGDANILDQIKMTAEPKSPEKINLRSKSSDDKVLKALFRNVQYGCSLGTASGGTAIDDTVAGDYATNVKDKYDNAAADGMRTRASVVDELTLPSSVTGNDAMQEEIIGKIVNLTKIEALGGSGFTVYILAQTIKDIGGPASGSAISMTKLDDDGNSVTKDCEIGTFDFDNTKSVYFDEITAEQKIKVRGVVSGGKVKITSFQYID